MTTHVLKNMRLWRGTTDLAGKTNQMKLLLTTPALEDTAVNTTGARSFVPGLNGATLDHSGFLDLGATSVEAALWAEQGLSDQPMIAAFAASVGSRAYLLRGIPSTLTPGGTVGELYAFSLQAQGSGEVSRGVILEPGATARTATFNGTATQDNQVASGKYLYAALLVLSASAGDTLDVVVESDALEAMGSPTTRITFTQAAAAGYEWKSVAGPITDDWWRITATIAGVDPSFTFVVAMGIAQ